MLMNSYGFIFCFLPIVFGFYFFLLSQKNVQLARLWLVITSLFFYSYNNPIYLPLILFSIICNYYIGGLLIYKNRSKAILTAGIVLNLGLLGYFKYANFFLENYNALSGGNIELAPIALPLAISFFTFQQIAFLVDSYHGKCQEYNLLSYALFVTFFPQLIAGPITHHKEMMPQFLKVKNLVKNYKNIATGILLFSIGIFKKSVIADGLAPIVNNGFDHAVVLNFFEAWATSLGYTLQLYFDFSGYTDMAIGIALLFNIRLPINFNSPYKAHNIQDFWRRWHITLSSFLRDYLYIPLGGNLAGRLKTYRNLFIVFVVGGLWHGASWMFVIWGAFHGIAIVIHRIYTELGFKIHRLLAWFITFNFINITWVFFRAHDLNDAFKVLKGMFALNDIILPRKLIPSPQTIEIFSIKVRGGEWLIHLNTDYKSILAIFFILLLALFGKNTIHIKNRFTPNIKFLLFALITFYYSLLSVLNVQSEFLYFNF